MTGPSSPGRQEPSLSRLKPIETSASRPPDEWVAVIECDWSNTRGTRLADEVDDILELLAMWQPTGLTSHNRYAIGLRIAAPTPDQALMRAMAYHAEAVAVTGVIPLAVVRAEVTTVEEMERSWLADPEPPRTLATGVRDGLLCVELYTATRSLVEATSAAELVDIVAEFVRAIGGRVECGAPPAVPGAVAVDITLGCGEPRYATADAMSVAGLIIDRSLPALLNDARRLLGRILSRRGQPEAYG